MLRKQDARPTGKWPVWWWNRHCQNVEDQSNVAKTNSSPFLCWVASENYVFIFREIAKSLHSRKTVKYIYKTFAPNWYIQNHFYFMPKTGFVAEYNSCSCASRPWAVRAQVRLCGQPQSLTLKPAPGKSWTRLRHAQKIFLKFHLLHFVNTINPCQCILVSTVGNSPMWHRQTR